MHAESARKVNAMSNLRRRTAIAFAFMALLIPSAWFTWTNRDLPRFGVLHDDGILFASAKSLAATGEYRIVSLPESPYQTKYPPLYPLYLSMVWRLSRDFPSNLELSALFSWILLVPCLALIWLYYRRNLFDERRALLLTALCAINPYFILFSGNALTEVPFTCLLLAALITAERITPKYALLAGILAGCAYLCRTAGIALLIAMPVWYASRRAWRLGRYSRRVWRLL
jgi:4-amino-4-deoxy-L-arabinose transferase-like glycosyltransferase